MALQLRHRPGCQLWSGCWQPSWRRARTPLRGRLIDGAGIQKCGTHGATRFGSRHGAAFEPPSAWAGPTRSMTSSSRFSGNIVLITGLAAVPLEPSRCTRSLNSCSDEPERHTMGGDSRCSQPENFSLPTGARDAPLLPPSNSPDSDRRPSPSAPLEAGGQSMAEGTSTR